VKVQGRPWQNPKGKTASLSGTAEKTIKKRVTPKGWSRRAVKCLKRPFNSVRIVAANGEAGENDKEPKKRGKGA